MRLNTTSRVKFSDTENSDLKEYGVVDFYENENGNRKSRWVHTSTYRFDGRPEQDRDPGIITVNCVRNTSPYRNAISPSNILPNDSLYFGDNITLTPELKVGYELQPGIPSSITINVALENIIDGIEKTQAATNLIPYTYTEGTFPTGLATLVCHRISSWNPEVVPGIIHSGDTIYHGDELYWDVTFEVGYELRSMNYNSSADPYFVTGNTTAVGEGGVTELIVADLAYTFTLVKNSNVSSISLRRTSSPRGHGSIGELISDTGTVTVYLGDVLEGTATSDTHYHFGGANETKTTTYDNTFVESDITWSPTVNIDYYHYYTGTLPRGISSLKCYRSTDSVHEITNGSIIYYGEKLCWSCGTDNDGWVVHNNTYYRASDFEQSNFFTAIYGDVEGVNTTRPEAYILLRFYSNLSDGATFSYGGNNYYASGWATVNGPSVPYGTSVTIVATVVYSDLGITDVANYSLTITQPVTFTVSKNNHQASIHRKFSISGIHGTRTYYASSDMDAPIGVRFAFTYWSYNYSDQSTVTKKSDSAESIYFEILSSAGNQYLDLYYNYNGHYLTMSYYNN